jgi:hypothetical protein
VNRWAIRITTAVIVACVGGILSTPVISGMMLFFLIAALTIGVLDAVNLFFGDEWT